MKKNTETPIVIKVSTKCQAGCLLLLKEGKGMCMDGVVHIKQLGFAEEEQEISFDVSKIPQIIKALKNLPTLNERNSEAFLKKTEELLRGGT